MKWIQATRILSETTKEFNDKFKKLSDNFKIAMKDYDGDPADLVPPSVTIKEEDLIYKYVPFFTEVSNVDYISKDFDGNTFIKLLSGEEVYIKEHPNSIFKRMNKCLG